MNNHDIELDDEVLKPMDKGPWKAGVNRNDKRVYIESDDFTHDVRLYVDGDFYNHDEKMAYAISISDQLNAAPQPADPRRGEPVGYFYPWELERSLKAYPNGFPGAVAVYSAPQPAEPVKHDLYKKGDRGVPEQILDRNGDVVLDCCKRCGKAEIELAEPCITEPMQSDCYKECAIGDSNYAAGMLLGWNLCIDNDEEKFNRIRGDRLRAAAQASKSKPRQSLKWEQRMINYHFGFLIRSIIAVTLAIAIYRIFS